MIFIVCLQRESRVQKNAGFKKAQSLRVFWVLGFVGFFGFFYLNKQLGGCWLT